MICRTAVILLLSVLLGAAVWLLAGLRTTSHSGPTDSASEESAKRPGPIATAIGTDGPRIPALSTDALRQRVLAWESRGRPEAEREALLAELWDALDQEADGGPPLHLNTLEDVNRTALALLQDVGDAKLGVRLREHVEKCLRFGRRTLPTRSMWSALLTAIAQTGDAECLEWMIQTFVVPVTGPQIQRDFLYAGMGALTRADHVPGHLRQKTVLGLVQEYEVCRKSRASHPVLDEYLRHWEPAAYELASRMIALGSRDVARELRSLEAIESWFWREGHPGSRIWRDP